MVTFDSDDTSVSKLLSLGSVGQQGCQKILKNVTTFFDRVFEQDSRKAFLRQYRKPFKR
jgi:hypothetical protein